MSSLLLGLRIFLPGIAWSWPLWGHRPQGDRPWPGAPIAAGAAALVVGLCINLVTVLFLGELGIYRTGVEVMVLGIIAVSGFFLCDIVRRTLLKEHIRRCLPLFAVFALGSAVVMALPSRGEWILGGWDPGVYINEGISLSQEGTLHPEDPAFSTLEETEEDIFARAKYRPRFALPAWTDSGTATFVLPAPPSIERFPGVVAEPDRGTFSFEFFRLMPSMVALAHRTGGQAMALRTNSFLACISLIVLAALAHSVIGGSYALFAALVLITQPIWTYHSHVPVSEMLQLVLVLSLCLFLVFGEKGSPTPLYLSLLLFLLMLNRFSFLPFAGLFLVMMSVTDLHRTPRKRVWGERAIQVLAVLSGALVCAQIAPVSILNWDHLPLLALVFVLGLAGALLIDALGTTAFFRNIPEIPVSFRWAAGTLILLLVAAYVFRETTVLDDDADNFLHLLSYVGVIPAAAAVLGALLLFCSRKVVPVPFKGFLLFLLTLTIILIRKKYIVDVYPWATRRHLAYTVPFVALAAGYLPVFLLTRVRGARFLNVGAALFLAAAITVGTAGKAWRAASRVEFRGATGRLGEVADHIGEKDMVVVDTPRWGTPLTFIHGKKVLDGKHIWRFRDKERLSRAFGALAHLKKGGSRVLFLTSTPSEALSIYPLPIEPVTLIWEGDAFRLEEVVHSPRGGDFVTREKSSRFRLYEWHGSK